MGLEKFEINTTKERGRGKKRDRNEKEREGSR